MFKFYDLWISQSYNFPERQKQRILSWCDFFKRIQGPGLYQLFIQKISKKFHEPKESMIADKVDEKYVPSVYQKLSEDFGVLEKTKSKT